MSKNILIVESDTALSATLRQALEARGFAVQETTDGKGSVEQIRRDRPELVVLAVDLSAGQNGYLICGKLKKDDELKTLPIVIIGNPDGFAQHRKLKAHADDYVAKPVNADELVDRVGALIGFPELPAGEVVDDGLSMGGLDDGGLDGLGDEPVQGEELAIEGEPLESHGDELALLDNPFGDGSDDQPVTGSIEEPVEAPPESGSPEDDFSGLDSLSSGEDDNALDSFGMDNEKTVVGYTPSAPTPAPAPVPARPTPSTPPAATTRPTSTPTARPTPSTPAATPRTSPVSTPAAPAMSAADAAELRNLRARVAELEGALEDARGQASTAETRVQELEAELETKTTELETAKSSAGKNDSATLALREASNRKDREILRLKSELNQKEQEIVELQDRQLALEQQANGATDEIARRDAELKTLKTKTDQLTAERRRVEQQLAAAKEEARGATARASALQTEVDQYQGQTGEVEELRARAEQLDAELAAARSEADSLREELESMKAQSGQEADELRKRIAEMEDSVARNESRVARLYTRIKADEKLREKTKKALAIATQLLEEQPAAEDDEEAVA
ncbi:response regulator [Archangium sp.]|uniref:response regulator n=1 Tax=Archangium sp. TaxID=1872627 RepID=UPI002D46F9A3|nr:response regulator [Archangium sp.]HYO52235.1 response regulator [Archangium sp.]